MSFGFSISDIATLTQLATRAYDGWKNACGEYASFTNDLAVLQMLLMRVQDEAEAPKSLFTRNSDDAKGWEILYNSCHSIISKLQEILDKYKSLSTSRRKNWDRIRMGIEDLEKLKRNLVKQTTSLTAFLSVLGISSQSRIENKLVPEILERMDDIAARMRNGNTSSCTALTAYDNDDRMVWREFRREMIKTGIRSRDIKRYSAALQTYLALLQREGLLDEEEPPNTINTNNVPPRTPMSQSSSSATGSRFPIRELKRIPEDTDDIWCNEGRPNRTEDNNSGNAGEICVQAVETQKMVLGLERPDTLFAMHNLAVTYWFQGQYNDAEKLGVQVVQCQKRILGLEHPDTLSAMENLGQIYSRQERWKEAEELEVQVLEARKTVLGLKHPDTLLAMHHLALIFESRNRKDDALLLMRECHELSMQNLGEEHPCTKSSLQALNAWTPGDHEAIKLAIRLCTIPRT